MSSYSAFLDEAECIISIWAKLHQLTEERCKHVPLIDDICTSPKTADLYVAFLSFSYFFWLCLSCLILVGLLCKRHLDNRGISLLDWNSWNIIFAFLLQWSLNISILLRVWFNAILLLPQPRWSIQTYEFSCFLTLKFFWFSFSELNF